jgi:hypothetical protein
MQQAARLKYLTSLTCYLRQMLKFTKLLTLGKSQRAQNQCWCRLLVLVEGAQAAQNKIAEPQQQAVAVEVEAAILNAPLQHQKLMIL